jgi:hypothetical protein
MMATTFVVNGESVPAEDTICECGHWYDEHDCERGADPIADAFCGAPGCECESFRFSESASTPAAIADRGGDPDEWPDHVKKAVRRR